MEPIITLNRQDFIRFGRRHGSESIAREAQESLEQWDRDLPVLEQYGQGASRRTLFRELLATHENLRKDRLLLLSEKEGLVRERNEITEKAWELVQQGFSILTPVAREDEECATRLKMAMPSGDLDLGRSLGSIMDLINQKASALPPEIRITAIMETAGFLRDRLNVIFGQVDEAKGKPMSDTAELDELDGRLYMMMVDLNAAGRRAVRAGLIPSRPPFYRFNHLRRPRVNNSDPAPTP